MHAHNDTQTDVTHAALMMLLQCNEGMLHTSDWLIASLPVTEHLLEVS